MRLLLPILCIVFIYSCKSNQDEFMKIEVTYPETKMVDTIDEYFGEKVPDPYRWLEDDRSAETEDWVKRQNEVTFGYLNQIPFRESLRSKLEMMWNYERVSAPYKEGKYTYYSKNDGLQNQSVIYRKDAGGKEEVFLDPNTFSKDGTTSLGGLNFSEDGSLAAYSISEGGSDWRKIIVMNAETKEIMEDTLIDVKFSGISWYKNEGFYYSSYDKPKGSELSAKTDQHKLYYHKLGTKQSEDKLIFGDVIKRRYVGGSVTEDNKYLIISAANSTYGNEIYLLDLENPKSRLIPVIDNMENDTDLLDNNGTTLFFVTDRDAPNKKIVTVNAERPYYTEWKDLIAHTDNVLSASTGGGYIFASYMVDALTKVKQYDYNGNFVRDMELPGLGSAYLVGAKKDETEMYYTFTNYYTPGTIYKYDPSEGKSELYVRPDVKFNSDEYESKQVFYQSKDGTKVPMIISYKKGIKLDGSNPTILYGYGGFNISLTPSFSISNALWMSNGGIYAVANLRGGGEYGKEWHKAGTQMQKQNVFDDFIAAAEYLIKEKYTSSDYLALRGGSNGGLLVGAVMTQRPELAKVALPAVGVLDMLRYHTFTAGAGWAYDYGTSEQSEEMFKYLLAYSPVHNVKEVAYPATLVTTADHDDRVVPAHSFKFIAELQKKQQGDNPVLIRIETSAGHGAGKPTSKSIEEAADIFSFTLYNMKKGFN